MISAEWKGLDKAVKELGTVPEKVQRANVQALNRAIATTRTLAVRAIRAEVALSAAYVRDKLHILKATKAKPEATLSAWRRGVLLTRFPHKQLLTSGRGGKVQKRVGVQVTVTPGSKETFRHGFLMPLGYKKGGEPIVGIAHRIAGQGRKVKVHHAPSVSQVYKATRKDIAPDAAAAYRKQYQAALLFALRGST